MSIHIFLAFQIIKSFVYIERFCDNRYFCKLRKPPPHSKDATCCQSVICSGLVAVSSKYWLTAFLCSNCVGKEAGMGETFKSAPCWPISAPTEVNYKTIIDFNGSRVKPTLSTSHVRNSLIATLPSLYYIF